MKRQYDVTDKTARLILDLKNNRFQSFAKADPMKGNEIVRQRFKEIQPEVSAGGKIRHRDMKNALQKTYEILEEVIDVTVNDAWASNPFYRETAEFRNVFLGDSPTFVINDPSWVIVNHFSGNTWNTERQKFGKKGSITIPTSWFFAHVYDDYERFLTGAVTIEELVNALTQGFTRHVDSMITNAFQDAGNGLPSEFQQSGTLTTEEILDLIQMVTVYSGQPVTIYGTAVALSRLNELAEVKYSNEMMNELYTTGRLGYWMGNRVVQIPQSFVPNTYQFAMPNDVLYFIPSGVAPIKVVDEGETRALQLGYEETIDQTIDYQLQRKIGVGVVIGSIFGKYTIL